MQVQHGQPFTMAPLLPEQSDQLVVIAILGRIVFVQVPINGEGLLDITGLLQAQSQLERLVGPGAIL